jgi:hypothetical protein
VATRNPPEQPEWQTGAPRSSDSGHGWPTPPNYPGYSVPGSGQSGPAPFPLTNVTGPARRTPRHFRLFAVAWIMGASTVWAAILFSSISEYRGTQKNFTTLHEDAAKIRLPAGYVMSSASETGTSCSRGHCQLKQIWIWRGSARRTTQATCGEAGRALKAAFSQLVSKEIPTSPQVACDYDVVVDSLLHPGKGKRSIHATVPSNSPDTIELTLLYA